MTDMALIWTIAGVWLSVVVVLFLLAGIFRGGSLMEGDDGFEAFVAIVGWPVVLFVGLVLVAAGGPILIAFRAGVLIRRVIRGDDDDRPTSS